MRSNHTIAVTALAAASLGLIFWLLQAVPAGAAAQAVLVAALVVVGLTLTAGALHGLRPVGPAGFWLAPLLRHGRPHHDNHRHGHHHGHGFERREGPDAFFRTERFERLIAEVERRMSFTEPQAAAWAGLVLAVQAGARSIGDARRSLAEQSDAPVAPARLSGLETMLAVGLDAVRDLRPPFNAFYATLERHQKAIIDDLFDHARRG